MESWNYVSAGKGFTSDESLYAGGVGRGKTWELKAPSSSGSNIVCSSQEGLGNHEVVELGFSDMARRSWSSNGLAAVYGNAFLVEEESSSNKVSSSIVESNCRDTSLIDLKLGRLGDHRDVRSLNSLAAFPNMSPAESSTPARRARGFSSQTAYCQVHGCKKDLSSCKDYHRRHKVCEVHSKTSKVIVNGIEQRFCQQCSRFHLLAEFDDGKRSCRKRLAGHNERRRKPHGGIHSGRSRRFFRPYNGTRFQATSFSASSFVCQDILPSGIPMLQKLQMNEWDRRVKVEDGTENSPQSANPFTTGLFHSKSLLTPYSEKQCLPLNNDGTSTITRSNISDSNNLYLHNMSDSAFVSGSMISNASIGTEDTSIMDSPLTTQGLSGLSNSGCALSLLSSKSHNSSNYSLEFCSFPPLSTPGSGAHSCVAQVSEKQLAGRPHMSTVGLPDTLHLSPMTSAQGTHLQPNSIPNAGYGINDGINRVQGSSYMHAINYVSCEGGSTINLSQLSSELQRVEQQRKSMQVKDKSDTINGHSIT